MSELTEPLRLSPTAEPDPEPLRLLDEDGRLLREPASWDPAELPDLYRWMVLIRTFDRRMRRLQLQGRTAFFVPSEGEEGAQIGVAAALSPEDWVFPAYREQGVALYRGYTLTELIAQMLGTSGDLLKGRQMGNHFGTPRIRFAVASSPVGTQIPQAVGAAWTARLKSQSWVALCFFGDGATSTGDFHAGLTFAGVHKLPVIFCCKNNGWAISLPVSQQCAAPALVQKAVGYGVAGIRVDGNDLLAVREAITLARSRALAGDGPTLVELLTQRMGPHSTSDDSTRYRPDETLTPWRTQDPLLRLRLFMVRAGLWSDAEEQAAVADTEAKFTEALRTVEAQAPPDLESLFTDVYRDLPPHLREQWEERQA